MGYRTVLTVMFDQLKMLGFVSVANPRLCLLRSGLCLGMHKECLPSADPQHEDLSHQRCSAETRLQFATSQFSQLDPTACNRVDGDVKLGSCKHFACCQRLKP